MSLRTKGRIQNTSGRRLTVENEKGNSRKHSHFETAFPAALPDILVGGGAVQQMDAAALEKELDYRE